MSDQLKNLVRCHGCAHYFITYDRNRPYGCAKFGFKAKSLPSQVVIESTGMQCAYWEVRPATHLGRKAENQRKV
jgi:hypothetical protein